MNRRRETGFVRAAALLLVLIVVIGAIYLMQGRMDVSDAGKSVAGDLGKAADAVRDTSKNAILTGKVETALALSKSASGLDIDVDSLDGTVTLTGTVPSDRSKATVLQIAHDTEGVRGVVDRLRVDPRASSVSADAELGGRLTELQIENAVYERLLHATGVDARSIRVHVDGRVVELRGTVPDSIQKERAAALVASVAEVEDVRNELRVADVAGRSPSSGSDR